VTVYEKFNIVTCWPAERQLGQGHPPELRGGVSQKHVCCNMTVYNNVTCLLAELQLHKGLPHGYLALI
jgi:hypothetical protein